MAATEDILPLSSLYETWTAPPYGLRRGVLPVLAMAFILANRSCLAVYTEGAFRPELDRELADLILQGEHLIALRPVNLAGDNARHLNHVAQAVEEITGVKPELEPLAVARALVRFAFQLPAWTRRTSSLTDGALAIRRVLLTASDPHRAIFVDLPIQFEGLIEAEADTSITSALRELADAYPHMLEDLCGRMLAALSHQSGDLQGLQKRARTVAGLSGDFRLDAFANRLAAFDGTAEGMEGIASLAIDKPPRDWSDRDPDRAAMALADFALRFRQAELFARIKGREPTQHALAIAFGTGESGQTVMEVFDISDTERSQVSVLAHELARILERSGAERRLLLAALAEAGAGMAGDDTPSQEPQPLRKAAS